MTFYSFSMTLGVTLFPVNFAAGFVFALPARFRVGQFFLSQWSGERIV